MESLTLSSSFSVSEGGMEQAFELLHMMLRSPCWLEPAFKRHVRFAKIQHEDDMKSLDAVVSKRVMERLMPNDQRFQQPTPSEASALVMSDGQAALLSMLAPGNMEVSVVGDFDPKDLEAAAGKFLSTLPRREMSAGLDRLFVLERPVTRVEADRVTITDTAERSLLLAAFEVNANRWTKRDPENENEPLLQAYRELRVFSAMINDILYTHVREKRGLAYEVSFELSLPNHYPKGSAFLRCSPRSEDKLEACYTESMAVLQNLRDHCTEKEFRKALGPLVKSTEASLNTNGFWMSQLQQLQDDSVPQSFACFADVVGAYKSLTLEGVLETALTMLDFEDAKAVRVEGVTTTV